MKIKITVFAFFILINQLSAYPDAVKQKVQFTGNSICTYFNNFGVFNQNFGSTGLPGLTWHCNQIETYCFTSGLSALAYINGAFGMFSCSWKGELAPGYISDSVFINTPDFNFTSPSSLEQSARDLFDHDASVLPTVIGVFPRQE